MSLLKIAAPLVDGEQGQLELGAATLELTMISKLASAADEREAQPGPQDGDEAVCLRCCKTVTWDCPSYVPPRFGSWTDLDVVDVGVDGRSCVDGDPHEVGTEHPDDYTPVNARGTERKY